MTETLRRMLPETLETWYLLESGPGPAPWNMAVDEALLEAVQAWGQPVLRWYAWAESAASFGYFQRWADVERLTSLRPLVRRPTGGGVVPHENDWTYSLVFPPNHEWYRLRARESYCRLHLWIQQALAATGMTTRLAPAPAAQPGRCCFDRAEQADLLWDNRKIAGAAQRRTRAGLLIQGSIQPPPPGPDRGLFQSALLSARPARWTPLPPWPDWTARAAELAASKYGTVAFTCRR